MPPALILLMRLQARALLRRTVRGARRPRGIIFLCVGVAAFMLWLGPSILHAYLVRGHDAEKLRLTFPLAMLAFCVINLVTTAGERAVAFTPAEVDFLFPGPFTRRHLLGYKLLKSGFAALVTSALFSVFLLRYASLWIAAWIGVFLSLLFLQLLGMSIVFVGHSIGERAYTRMRKVVVVAILAAIALAILPLLRTGEARSIAQVAAQIRNPIAGRVLLAPFDVFGQIVSAESLFPDFLFWVFVAIAMLAGMLLLVFWLDAHYLETAATTGQRVYDQVRRVRRAGGLALKTTGSARRRLPQPPRFGGAGPIAWRQLTAATRQSRAVLVLMLVLGAVGGPILFFVTRDGRPGAGGTIGALAGVGAWMTFLFANAMRFDFRGDVDQIDVLKALPVSPVAVAVAQLIAPTIALAVCQLLLLGGVVIFLRLSPAILLAGIVVAIPFNLLLFAIENIIFLIFPARLTGVGPGDFQSVGRQVIVLFVKIILMLLGGGIAIAAGAIAHALSGESFPVAALVVAAVLLGEVAGLLPALVYAYNRFDPSTDTPPA